MYFRNAWRALFAVALLVASLSSNAFAQTSRDVSHYNLESGLGLMGYDPVSYFPEGGGTPTVGLKQFKIAYMGVTYMFATSANLDLFVENPDKYEPTYGGFCAYAMAFGSKVDIKPTIFTINGNRLHFFVSTRAKKNFDNDLVNLESQADSNWRNISGEEPRL